MVVGIDASRAIADRPTGTEVYSRRLIEAILAHESAHCFRLYLRQTPPRGLFCDAELRIMPFPRLWTHVRLSWEMARHPPDSLFVPAHVLPAVHPSHSLVTVHDLGYLRFPSSHPWQQRWYLHLSTRWNAYAATHLLADSEATKTDLTTFYGVPADKISVAYPGVDEALKPVSDPASIEAAKARYDIRGAYFMYLGTLQPRKNLPCLVEAFATFTARHPSLGMRLVLAGKRGWLYDDLAKQMRGRGLDGQVQFPGYVAEEDKAALLSGATAFMFPSLHEGFGLPVLEAQACGCPVITSNTSSLPEVAGDAALLVAPQDATAIAVAMERIALTPKLREALVERGLANARRFSWKFCAESVLKVIDDHLC